MHRKKSLTLIGIVLIPICFSVCFLSGCSSKHPPTGPAQSSLQSYADKVQQQGIMSSKDLLRLNSISLGVEKTYRISDEDLNWALNLSNGKPFVDAPENRVRLHAKVMSYVMEVKYYTPKQQQAVFAAAVPLLASNEAHDRKVGVRIMDDLQDNKAIPYLKPLLKDTDAEVRASAAELLGKLSKVA